jgi:hypothetical protein
MTSLIRIANRRMENASLGDVCWERIGNPQVSAALRLIWRCYRRLDADSPKSRDWRASLWRLAMGVSHTLLPFADESLAFRRLAEHVGHDPTLSVDIPAAELLKTLEELLLVPQNPKFARIATLAAESATRGETIAVLSALTHRPETEGWPRDSAKRLTKDLPDILFVASVRAIEAGGAPVLVVPSGGRQVSADLLQDLYSGGLARRVVFLGYDAETFRAGVRPLWTGGVRLGVSRVTSHSPPPSVDPASDDEPDHEPWRWTPLTSQLGAQNSEITVSARAVLFEGGQMILLPEEGRVIEISALLAGAATGGRLPRRAVTDLRRGDVLVLRLSGSGDHLDSVADELMAQEGEGDLRERSVDWRTALGTALRTAGSGRIARILAEEGFAPFVTPGYLAYYVTGIVIGPESVERFASLARALVRHGFLNVPDSDVYARDHWKIIMKIRSWQRRAASVIRAQLLDALSERLHEGELPVGQTISLAGTAAGELGLLRVAETDPEQKKVAPGQLYQLHCADGDLF